MAIKLDSYRVDDYKVYLENNEIKLTMHPNRGGLISSIITKEKGLEYLAPGQDILKTPDILAFPSSDAIHNAFRGGYFEVIPNAGYKNKYNNVEWVLHSETPYIPWEIQFDEDENPNSILFIARLIRYPLTLYRRISLSGRKIIIKERLVNNSETELKFSWLHHPTFGGDILDDSTELTLPTGKVISDEFLDIEDSEFFPGTTGNWPFLTSKRGSEIDISKYPPKGAQNTNDLIYYPDLLQPRFTLYNNNKDFGISAEWDKSVFSTIWIWRCMGGGFSGPWYGRMYATSIEITSSWPASGISKQVENKTALTIKEKGTIESFLNYTLIIK
jgi:hypothetical protein